MNTSDGVPSAQRSVPEKRGFCPSTTCSSTITQRKCSMEEMQNTLNRFRELCGTLRTYYRSGSPSSVDRSDEALRQFSDCPLPQGFTLLRGILDPNEQLDLARKAMDEYAFYPHNNLSALGKSFDGQSTLKKIRWSCLGMNYDWTNRKYVEGWKSDFPEDLADLCRALAAKGGFSGTFVPEAAIVNFYTPSQMMGPHRDDAELTMNKPIVSISLGCEAIFCIETKPFDRNSEVTCLWVRSGDVVIMGGESREALHGIAVTIPSSYDFPTNSPIEKRPRTEDKRVYDYLRSNRINLNVRQVEDPVEPLCTFAGRNLADFGMFHPEQQNSETEQDFVV